MGKPEYSLVAGILRFWYRLGVSDARLPAPNFKSRLAGWGANLYKPEHYRDVETFYMLGYRRAGRRRLKREFYQRAGMVNNG